MLHLHCRSSSSTSNSPPSRSWSLQRANVWPLPPDFSSTSPMSRLRPRLSSTTPMLHLLRRSSYSTSISPPSRSWSPRDAFAAATERVRAGTLSPEDEHHLFDELLGQATPVPSRSFNGFIDLVKAKGLVSEMMNKASGLVPNASTYSIRITNYLKEGLVEDANNIFSSMEKSGIAPSSHLINYIIRMLLEKGEIAKAGHYLSKVDGNNILLEASTTSLMLSLFSRSGKYQENIKLLPAKYQSFDTFG